MTSDALATITRQNVELQRHCELLSNRNKVLQQQIEHLTMHPSLSRGLAGETLIAEALDGKLADPNAAFDITTADGLRVEVKRAKSSVPMKTSKTLRWAWTKLLGNGGNKFYDFVLLLGDADPRYAQRYRDPDSPFVMFCIPYDEVQSLTVGGGTEKHRSIFLTTNPAKVRGASAPLFEQWQITMRELKARFHFLPSSAD